MKLCSIASGSSGNCIYVGGNTTGLLVDVGISKKRIEQGLDLIGIDPCTIHGILITHEHSDHIRGLGVMSRRYHIPIYATPGTIREIRGTDCLGKIEPELFHEVKANQDYQLGDIKVHPIKTSHDAAESVAYRFENENRALAIMTDLGTYDEYIVSNLQGLDAILLESNHDIRMLEVGRYPYPLKQRILGDRGHLSNEASVRLMKRIFTERLKYILLGHLSKENNMPILARETYRYEMIQSGIDFDMSRVRVAGRDEVSEMITF